MFKPLLGTKLNMRLEINQGLVAAYLINEGNGSVVNDACGTYPATAIAAKWIATANGWAINAADSANSYFNNAGGIAVPAVPVSVIAWGQASSAAPISDVMASVGSPTGTGFGLRSNSSGHMGAEYDNTIVSAVATIDLNPHMWAMTNNGATNGLIIYDNGAVSATGTKALVSESAAAIGVGGSSAGTSYWTGYVEQVMIWVGRALSAADIASLYANRYQSWAKPGFQRYFSVAAATTTLFRRGLSSRTGARNAPQQVM